MIFDLFAAYRRAVMHKTNPTRKEAFERFLVELKRDHAALEALAQDYFDRKANSHWQAKEGLGTTFKRIGYQHAERTREDFSRDITKIKEAIRNTVLLDMELPNGKLLRFATGAECAKAGGFYSAVAVSIKPTQVVDKHLTETDLQNIRARYFQVNKEAENAVSQ